MYVLGLTIYYEIGDISRFSDARQFASYCRLAPGISQSSYHDKERQVEKTGESLSEIRIYTGCQYSGPVLSEAQSSGTNMPTGGMQRRYHGGQLHSVSQDSHC